MIAGDKSRINMKTSEIKQEDVFNRQIAVNIKFSEIHNLLIVKITVFIQKTLVIQGFFFLLIQPKYCKVTYRKYLLNPINYKF